MEKRSTAGPMLMPKFVSRFECTGGDCEDTCCSGWRIDLDRATLLQYESCEDPELRPLLQEYVKRNTADATVQACGHIQKLDDTAHYCPFLDAAKLCRIQSRLGAEGLSDTCSDYPRSTVLLGDFHQTTLKLSCPVAARLALLEPDAFDMEAREARVRTGGIGKLEPSLGLSLPNMDEIRTHMYQILHERGLDLSRRLAILGLYCQRLTELAEQGKQNNIPGLMDAMDAYVEQGAVSIPLRPREERERAQVQFASIFLLAMRVQELSPLQRRVVDAAVAALGINPDGTLDGDRLLNGYQAGAARLGKALESAPLVLEHYLLNEALRELLPWSLGNPMQHFIQFLLRFTILRVFLAGRAASKETPLTPWELAETVHVFCRRVQNGRKIIDQFNLGSGAADWTSLRTLFTLV